MIGWLKSTLPALGGAGLFLAAFLDSSFVPMPLVTDLIVMDLSSRHPARTPYFAALAAFGSLAGCIWIYLLVRRGGEAYYRKRQGQPRGRIYSWVRQHPLMSVLLPAMAPFPVPFKPFVLAQGLLQVPIVPFVVGTFVGRGCLFFFEGFLGERYGDLAKEYLLRHAWVSAAMILGLVILFLAITRYSNYRRRNEQQAS
ncbi:MAG: VTT domain-containing protein [Candidatus Acidiferrales bacterium]